MKQTGIVDRFEGDQVVVEVNGKMVNFPRADAPAMLAEGMVVILRDGRITEIDQIETQRIKDESIALIERFRPKVLKLDFADVTFVDSSGIGYVLARYQQLRKWQGEVVLCNLTRLNQTIFEMSGIFQIIRYEKSEGRK